MIILSRWLLYSYLFVVSSLELEEARALSPRISKNYKSTPGSSSLQKPLLHLSTKSRADDGDSGNDSDDANADDDRNANDFVSKASKISQPSKSDLYDDDELAGLLELHQQLQSSMMPPQASIEATTSPQTIESPSDLFAGGLHDMILRTLDTIDEEAGEDKSSREKSWISDDVKDKISKFDIIAVASDVDGTIIGFDQTIHPKTVESIKAAQKSSEMKWIFPATGKTRWGARNSLGPELSSLTEGPGVYVQGLYCLGNNGEVVFEKKLESNAVEAAEQLAADLETAVVAYDGDDLYTTDSSRIEVIELHEKWGEPASREIPALIEHSSGVNKILLMDNDVEKLKEARPKLEELAKDLGCVVTQAVPSMLELLPSGCSKAKGVQMVCEHLGIDPASQLLTIGDAENDVEMLEASAIGVAVGNACSSAKRASDIVLPLNSSDGAVGMALIDVIGLEV